MNARDEHIKGCIEQSISGADPEWAAMYDALARILLLKQRYVCGDDFKDFAKKRGLWEPRHHNHWVGRPVLIHKTYGWMEPLQRVVPRNMHNHMNDVTFYVSKIFDEETLHKGIPK